MPLTTNPTRRSWSDPLTGRCVRQLTHAPRGARLDYFRLQRFMPDGRIFIRAEHDHGNFMLLDLDGFCTPLRLGRIVPIKLRAQDGRLWYQHEGGTEVWCVDLPDGEPRRLCALPRPTVGVLADVTCDGSTLLMVESEVGPNAAPVPTTKDADALWRFFNRPRRGALLAVDLATGSRRNVLTTDGVCVIHVECSPLDPGLVRYAQDMYDAYGQRVWTVRLDGSAPLPIRPQAHGELVTHEFWWADGQRIGYTYQDRRDDPTIQTLPWAEYSPRPTQLGLADPDGKEVYLSDPLPHYHTHLYVSPDGQWVNGEGTDGHFGVFAGRFDITRTRLDLTLLASIRSPYVPFRGQFIDAGFSPDSRWLLYNDTIDGQLQVCAVAVEG